MKQVKRALLLATLALLVAVPASAGNLAYFVGQEAPVEMLPLSGDGVAIVLLSRDGHRLVLFTLSNGQSSRMTTPACIAGDNPDGVPSRVIVRGVGKYIHVMLDCPDLPATVYHRWSLPDGLIVEDGWQPEHVYLPFIGGER